MYIPRNKGSWGLLGIYWNRLFHLCRAKEAGHSTIYDITDVVKLSSRCVTLIGVYHLRWDGGFLTWGFFGLGSHGSYSCSGNLIIAFLGFSNFAPSSVDPLSPHRTWGQESILLSRDTSAVPISSFFFPRKMVKEIKMQQFQWRLSMTRWEATALALVCSRSLSGLH